MKKTLTLFLTAQITLFAGISNIQALYDQQKYERVISEAQKSISEYSNPKLHLLWAKSAAALHRDEMAMSAYERVLMLDPDNTEVRVNLTLLYADLEREELVDQMLKSTQNYQLTPAQRTSLETLSGYDLDSLNVSASIGIGYDSNINVSPDDLDLPEIGENIGTMFTQFKSRLSYTNDLNEKGGWYMRSDADIFYQNNTDASYYDLFVGAVAVGLGYSNGSYDILFPVTYGYLNYLDRDLLESISFNPRVNFPISKTLIGNVNARYTERNYMQEVDKGGDDYISGVGLGLYRIFENNFAYFNTNYDNYIAKYSDGFAFIDKEKISVSMGINYNVKEWFVARFDYRYAHSRYEDIITLEGDKRSDNYHQTELKISRMFTDTMEALLFYRYAKNNSNYDLAEYDKNIVMFGLQYNYKETK